MGKQTVALAGGTGNLGNLVADALLDKPDVELRLLVRPGSREKAHRLEKRGARVVEGGIGQGEDAALAALTEGASAVVSTLQGRAEIIIDGQTRLLSAARKAGVRRFIPSDFSLDIFKIKPGHIVPYDLRRRFASTADSLRGEMEVVHILNGGFLDRRLLFGFLGVVDLQTRTAYVWGEGKTPMDWTTYADTARYTAEVALDERPLPREFAIAGDVQSFEGVVASYEEASGKKLSITRLGSLEDLSARIDHLRQTEPENVHGWLPLMYYRSMLSGEGRLTELMNDRYPSVRPTNIREYVGREGL